MRILGSAGVKSAWFLPVFWAFFSATKRVVSVSWGGSTIGPFGPHVCPNPSNSAAVARSLRSIASCKGVWPLSVRAFMSAALPWVGVEEGEG